jgi:hypothetical protein
MHFFSACSSMSFADAITAAKEALEREEFLIVAEIDMRQVLKRYLSVDLRPYLILSACNLPSYTGPSRPTMRSARRCFAMWSFRSIATAALNSQWWIRPAR